MLGKILWEVVFLLNAWVSWIWKIRTFVFEKHVLMRMQPGNPQWRFRQGEERSASLDDWFGLYSTSIKSIVCFRNLPICDLNRVSFAHYNLLWSG